jgi:hypothetical protein
MRRIFGPKREELKGEWRKLHSEELNDLATKHCSGDHIIEKNEMDGACSMCVVEDCCIHVFYGET